MRRVLRLGLPMLAAMCVAAPSGAHAQTIDTTPMDDLACCLGPSGGVPTLGQTVTAPNSSLSSFTFYVKAAANSPALNFQAKVYAWDGTRATGPALFASAPIVVANDGTFNNVTVVTGGLQLTQGQQYVLFFTIAGSLNSPTERGEWALNTANPYAGGDFTYTFDPDPTASSWLFGGFVDSAFMAVFGPGGLATNGLNDNQTGIADNVNDIITSGGSPGLAPLITALTGLPSDQLPGALNQLSPEIYSYEKIETLYAAEQFSSDLLSCRVADGSGYSVIREGQCMWARARARFLDLDATAANIGADTTVGTFSAGGQVAVAPDVHLGFAAGYDMISLGTGTGASAEGERANVGGVLKYNPGPLLLSAAVAGGWSDFDTTRNIAFGGFAGQATGDSNVDYVLGRLHAAYLVQQAGWYLKPFVDATVTQLDFDGVEEAGGGGAALFVASDSDTYWAISPALEVGSAYRLSSLSVLRPFLRAGVTWRDGDNVDLAAGFAAAPVGVGPFTINTAMDDVLADVAAGFDVINGDGAVVRLQYDGRFGEDTQQNSASIKGSVPF